ncbi:MAG: N-acetylmuramoyl-L-alanine amidase [Limnochordaceae bacterium]|nr:N-acetylmuramoyl-L-alanine amidase [Limnochordaceae bacterium]
MRRPGDAASEGAPAEPGEVTGVLVRRDGGRARVEVLSHGPVKLESAPTVLRDPPRLVLDIANARLTAPTSEYPASGALVKGVRLGQPSPGVVRVAVDLTAAVGFELEKDPEDGHVSVTLHYAVTGVHWLRDAAGRGQVWLEMSGLAPVKTSVLSDPLRLAVDLQKATLVAPAGEWEVSQGPVRRYRVSQYQPDVVRVVMELAQPVQPRVITSLDLTRQLLASQAAVPLPAGGETAPGSAEPGGPGGAPPTVDLVLDVYSRITQIAVRPLGSGGASVTVHATGPVEPRAFYLRRPDRLVLDIPGAVVDPSLRTGTGAIQVPKDGSLARAVRVGQFLPRSARVVVELERPVGFQVFSADERETAIIALGNQPLQGRVVAIDPGHGGFDPGAIGASGTPEKVYNLDIGRRVGKLLESVGVEVALTRRDDTFVGLDDRVELAKKLKAEVFVSIHHNASTSTLGSGTEVFYSPNHPASQRLAELLYDALLDKLHQAGRGLEMRGDLRVLRLAPMPAALVEVAFVDNAQEERRLMDPGFRQQAADAIFSAIVSFLSQTGHDTVGKVNAQMLAAEGRQAH